MSPNIASPASYFNPRAHEGHDHDEEDYIRIAAISIHVPTRGTTLPCCRRVCLLHFNPRAHEGHDRRGATVADSGGDFNPRAHEGHDSDGRASFRPYGFQSTCPRGARRCVQLSRLSAVYFNPRAHEGHDFQVAYFPRFPQISIHVPTRGTTWSILTPHYYAISIHVPTRGTTAGDA